LLADYRRRALANEFMYPRSGTDPAVAFGMVLQGDFSGGVKFLQRSIEHQSSLQNNTGRDLSRTYLAEIYIELLAPKQRASIVTSGANLTQKQRHEFA